MESSNTGTVILRLGSSRRAVAALMQRRGLVAGSSRSDLNRDIQQLLLDNIAQLPLQSLPRADSSIGVAMGVFSACTSTIFGVVAFLRLGFLVGQAGWWFSLLVVFASFILCILTTLSLCALISDGGDAPASEDNTFYNIPGGACLPRAQGVGMRL